MTLTSAGGATVVSI